MDRDQRIASIRKQLERKTDAQVVSFKLQADNPLSDMAIACEMELAERGAKRLVESARLAQRLTIIGIVISLISAACAIPSILHWLKD